MDESTREVLRSGPFREFIADGVRVGNVVYLSGQVSVDDEGDPVAVGDLVAQARQAYTHIRSILAKFGGEMEDIVDEVFFVTDISDVMIKRDPLFEARAEAYGGQPEVTQTLVQVSGLVMPELLIEIKCVAHLKS